MSDDRDSVDARDALLPLIPSLRAFARSLTGSSQNADDLVQDTLMLALQAWERFRPGTNLKAWLFTILRNRFHTVRTRRYVVAEIGGLDDLDQAVAAVPAEQERRLEMRSFRASFASLSPGHREVLVLFAVHGFSYERIGEICGCDVGAVKSRMSRARAALKRRLMADDDPAKTGMIVRENSVMAREGATISGRVALRQPVGDPSIPFDLEVEPFSP